MKKYSGYKKNISSAERFANFIEWADDHTEFGSDYTVSTNDIFDAYNNYCVEQCLDTFNRWQIGWAMKYYMNSNNKEFVRKLARIAGPNTGYCSTYFGIRLKETI